MKCQMENQYGTILVDENVIATLSGIYGVYQGWYKVVFVKWD